MNVKHSKRAAYNTLFLLAGLITMFYGFFGGIEPWWMGFVVAFAGFGCGILAADDYEWFKRYKEASR